MEQKKNPREIREEIINKLPSEPTLKELLTILIDTIDLNNWYPDLFIPRDDFFRYIREGKLIKCYKCHGSGDITTYTGGIDKDYNPTYYEERCDVCHGKVIDVKKSREWLMKQEHYNDIKVIIKKTTRKKNLNSWLDLAEKNQLSETKFNGWRFSILFKRNEQRCRNCNGTGKKNCLCNGTGLDLKKQREELNNETYDKSIIFIKKEVLQKNNLDKIGKCYLKKANEEIIKLDFRNAYNNIINGFDYVVCDCAVGNWIINDLDKSLIKTEIFNCTIYQLNLVKAYVFWICKKFEIAMNFISNYIHLNNNIEIGYYLKGRIYAGMEDYTKALDCYIKALSLKKTSRTLYRIGLTKEILNKNGLKELYEASLSYVISHCTGRLSEYSRKRGILLPKSKSLFIDSFNTNANLIFYFSEEEYDKKSFRDDNGREYDFREEEYKLFNALLVNKNKFYDDGLPF